MGAAESSESEDAAGPGVATGLLRLKQQKSKGEISEEQYNAGMPADARAPVPRLVCRASLPPSHSAIGRLGEVESDGICGLCAGILSLSLSLSLSLCRLVNRGQSAPGRWQRARGTGSTQRHHASAQRRCSSRSYYPADRFACRSGLRPGWICSRARRRSGREAPSPKAYARAVGPVGRAPSQAVCQEQCPAGADGAGCSSHGAGANARAGTAVRGLGPW